VSVELLSGNHAAATAATLAARANRAGRGFASGLYPITPSTECMELLCAQELPKGAVVRVESEHSAMAVCIGAAAAGARTFTATSANGLVYMAENALTAALLRLPVVMVVANRTLGPPWNVWADHGDSLMLRDAGWVQLYCADNQEVLDSVLCAFRLAEDRRVLLPVMVCQEGFVLSHTVAQTEVPDQSLVDRFLPPLDLATRLRGEARVLGGIDTPHVTEAHRAQHHQAMVRARAVYDEVQDAFQQVFGRRPHDPVVAHRIEDAETVVISMGTIASTVDRVVDAARARGERVGSLRVRMLRPFPGVDLGRLLRGATRVAVIDRDISLGLGGVLWAEARATAAPGALVQGYLVGLGGGDPRPSHVEELLGDLSRREAPGDPVILEAGT